MEISPMQRLSLEFIISGILIYSFLEKGFDVKHAEKIENLSVKTLITGPRTALESLEIKNSLFYGFGDTRRPDSSAKGP
jgi:hypothetical protein